jgi:hypothetical protein
MTVKEMYFNSNLSYHIDCVIALVDVGIIGLSDNALWTPLLKAFKDWEIIRASRKSLRWGSATTFH